MSGGTISRSLFLLPEELRDAIEQRSGELNEPTLVRLERLIARIEETSALVRAADLMLSGDTSQEGFNFEWNSILQETDDA